MQLYSQVGGVIDSDVARVRASKIGFRINRKDGEIAGKNITERESAVRLCSASLAAAKYCAAIKIDGCAADRSVGAIPDSDNYPAHSIQGEIDVDDLIL